MIERERKAGWAVSERGMELLKTGTKEEMEKWKQEFIGKIMEGYKLGKTQRERENILQRNLEILRWKRTYWRKNIPALFD